MEASVAANPAARLWSTSEERLNAPYTLELQQGHARMIALH
jgi:hypothetical protein